MLIAAIFLASSIPGSELPVLGRWDTFAKKAGHILGYALLTSAFLRALCREDSRGRLKLIAPICLAILFAISDEWHQSFVPGRTASLGDVVIDAVGSILGLAVWLLLHKKLPGIY